MDFVARIREKGQITIPLAVMEYDGLVAGDIVMISVRKKSSVDQLKRNIEKAYIRD